MQFLTRLPWLSMLIVLAAACGESKETRLQKFLLKGNLARQEGNIAQARYYYQEALKLEPCFAPAANNLGTILFYQRQWEQALGQYNKAISCQPDFIEAYFNRANTYYELKEYYNALNDLNKIQAQKPDTAVAYFTRGLVLTRMRDFDNALEAFDRAIKLNGDVTACQVNKATIHFYQKKLELAEMELHQVLQSDSTEPNVYNTLAMIAAERSQHDAALRWIGKALALAPHDPFYLNNRGYIYLSSNELSNAERDINESITIDPYNGWAYRNKGIFYLMKEDYGNAERLLKQALQMDEFIDKIHFYYGMALFKSGKKAEACQQFDLSEELGDNMLTTDLIKACR